MTPPDDRFQWRPDPYGRHAWRYFADGVPTEHVRDGDHDGIDPPGSPIPPPPGGHLPPSAPPAWASSSGPPPPLWDTYQEAWPPERLPDPLPQEGRPWELYRSDLTWSAKAMFSAPLLVAVTIAITLLSEVVARFHVVALNGVLEIGIGLFTAGFTGTLRVWFLRVARGKPLGSWEFWHMTGAFLGRFLVLGLVVLVPLFALATIGIGIWSAEESVHIARNPVTGLVTVPTSLIDAIVFGTVAVGLVVDVLLTFVVPALSFTTKKTGRALRLGYRTMRLTWPKCAWYVFAPGLTLGLLAVIIPRTVVGLGIDVVLGIIGALLGLWFKGAIVAFYLRSFPLTPDTGASNLRY